jgi:hypothetical protein
MEQNRSALVEQIMEVLNRHDPMGLEPAVEAPWDEYEPEARDLAQLLHVNGRVTGEEVNEVWRKWFDEVAGSPEFAEDVAADIRALRA